MKTALLLAMTSLMVVGSNAANAHEAYRVRHLPARDFFAMSPVAPTATVPADGMLLRGPTNDPLSTATGGPSGGLPDRN